MNIIQRIKNRTFAWALSLVMVIIFLVLFVSFLAAPSKAGPVPWTANQFATWYATGNSGFTVISNAANTESNFFQTTIPGQTLGNNGVGTVQLFVSSSDAASAMTWKVYLGGTGTANPPAGATCISTNVTTDTGDLLQQIFFTQGNATNVYTTGFTSTNVVGGFIGSQKTIKVLGTTTNLLLTVTGASSRATNVMTLDNCVVGILQMP